MKKSNLSCFTRKNVCLLLLIGMMTSLFACAKEEVSTEQNPAADNTLAVETAAEPETEDPIADRTLQDNVPELNFGGADFRTVTQQADVHIMDVYAAEITGDSLNDAVYNRNLKIQERFNVNIVAPNALQRAAIGTLVKKSVRSGEDAYELILGQMEESGKTALDGCFRNLLDLPYMDFEKPWYPKSIMQDGITTVNGKMFMAVSDMLLLYTEQCWAFIFDKVYANNYGITGIYDTVRSGDWTLDQLIQWTDNIYMDSNHDGQKDESDFYGLAYLAEGCSFAASLYGLGVRTMEINDGKAEMVLHSERTVSVFEKLYSMLNNTGTWKGNTEAIFQSGNAVFANYAFSMIRRSLREYENDFGVIPLPKWDESQEQYYTTTDAGCQIIAVLTTAQNLEMIGAVTEAMAAESWRTVMPVFCDDVLGAKMARDAESLEMINLCLDSRYIDFAYLYDGWEGWTFKLESFVAQEGAFASTYETTANAMQNYYDKVVNFFYED